jgi:hypothetical protein
MKDIPIAVINGARRGAPRSGLYAIRSIVALRVPQNAIPIRRLSRTTGIHFDAASWSWSEKVWTVSVAAIIAPSMNTSPWAKLISSRIP